MKILFDTSVLVAALLPSHQFHAPAFSWLDRAQSGAFEFVVSAHTLAELYATLTGTRLKPQLLPATVLQMIEDNVLAHATVRALSESEYHSLITDLSNEKLIGGVTYDAVIARVAELAGADLLVTLNLSDFQRVWSSNINRVVSPLTTSPP